MTHLTSSPPLMEEIPAVSEIIGISDHLGGFLLRRGCPGEKAWFSPRSTPAVGSLTASSRLAVALSFLALKGKT